MNYLKLWCDYGGEEYARLNTAVPLYEHFGDVDFLRGKTLKDVFPRTQIALKARPAAPDYLTIGSLDVVSQRLRSFLEQQQINAEYLELDVVQKGGRVGPYYFMNPLDIFPCLDRARSRFEEETPAGQPAWIVRIHELYVDESKVGNSRLFVLDEKPLLLARSDLVDRLKAHEFTGLAYWPLPLGPF